MTAFVMIGALAIISGIIGLTSLNVTADDWGVRSDASLPLHEGETLRVHTTNGRITYETITGDQAHIEATVQARALTAGQSRRYVEQVAIDIARSADGVLAAARLPESLELVNGVSVDFHVRVPRTWRGHIELRTVNGAVTATDLHGGAEIVTRTGPITIRSHTGTLNVHTVNGAITVSDADTVLTAHTENGSIDVKDVTLTGNGYARTSNGSIRLRGYLQPSAALQVTTSNGNVSLGLLRPDVVLDLEAANGHVRLHTDVKASEKGPDKLIGRLGAGTARLLARASNGTIELFRIDTTDRHVLPD